MLSLLIPVLGGCIRPTPPTPVSTCALSWDDLGGTEWLFLRYNPDRTQTPDVGTRLRLEQDGAGLSARYNVGSLSDMYDYACALEGDALICRQPADVRSWCLSALASGLPCADDWLLAEEPSLTPEEIKAGRDAALEEHQRWAGTDSEPRYRLMHNNLGNKLRGVLTIQIDAERCRLQVYDMYRTVFNGRWVEDSNPVGLNPFVPNDQGELLWEHCDNIRDLVDLPNATIPEDLDAVESTRSYPVGAEVHYRLLAPGWRSAAPGCAHRFDVWHSARPVATGLSPEVIDGVLHWTWSRTYPDPTPPGQAEVAVIVAHRACPGQAPEKTVACSAVRVE